ncbi:protein of unknown function [Halogranum amylolyticum]|uniref:DUF4112 domain-containing protein n=1 Tax=Halogranum amylolyticum TaxID=660520 RepID=A0A1H8U5R9_9EURY|nr:DUF4112 domain-containing protein [Halogranum amylolyticum]SEO98505.1 protein of unknown function [Halogranum amylolyticum]
MNDVDLPDDSELFDAASEAALQRSEALASLLDDGIELPVIGVKIGLDPLLGLLPVSGDLVSSALSLYIPLEAARLGVPMTAIGKMLAYIGLDLAIGSIPVLGTIFDTFWRANRRNVNLLEKHLDASAE